MQLRYQQTLVELGGDKSTIVFPLPLDLIAPFLAAANGTRVSTNERATPSSLATSSSLTSTSTICCSSPPRPPT